MMEDDLDELLHAYLNHWDEVCLADYFVPGSSEAYYKLRANFMEKYSND